MSYARALRCRKCGQEYPLQPLSLCDFCLSPLEVSYDYTAMARGLSREKLAGGPLSPSYFTRAILSSRKIKGG